MRQPFQYHDIPPSRIATFDVYTMGLKKHHVSALLEFDVTETRQKLRELKRNGQKISLNAWIIKAISKALEQYPEAAAFLCSKKKLITFDDINISIMVEKELDEKRVPVPLVIEGTNQKSAAEITAEIEDAKNQSLAEGDIVLNKPSQKYERLYYRPAPVLATGGLEVYAEKPQNSIQKHGKCRGYLIGHDGKTQRLVYP